MQRKSISALAMAILLLSGTAPISARAAGSQAELRQILADLLTWWPGDYDTLPQVDYQHRLGAPPDGEHDRQSRRFRRVDVPHIGDTVIYGEVHIGNIDGDIIPGQNVLYIISIDAARDAVHVSGRRILNGAQFSLKDQTPEKMRTVQLDPNVGGNCHFLWRREGRNLVAHLSDLNANNRTCTMVSRTSGQKMTWDAEWVLTPDELWVFDNGYLHDKDNPARPPRLFAGREDRAFEKMYKGKAWRCTIRGAAAKSQAVNLLDQGGEFTLPGPGAGETRVLQLLRSDYEHASGVGLERRLRLALLPAGSDEPLASTLLAGNPRQIRLQHEGVDATCRP